MGDDPNPGATKLPLPTRYRFTISCAVVVAVVVATLALLRDALFGKLLWALRQTNGDCIVNWWLFVGNDDAGEVNASFVSLLASCQLHRIEPWGYLRDLFCLLPSWSSRRVLELAPVSWPQTVENPEVQQRLAGNIFRRASLNQLRPVGTAPLANVG
jgi:hypothetical protein